MKTIIYRMKCARININYNNFTRVSELMMPYLYEV